MPTPPPSYAPTSTSSYAPAGDNHLKFHQEITRALVVKLPQHKAVYDSLAEMYSIITALEVLENAFLKDYITDKDKYTSTVLRLLNQYLIIVKSFEVAGPSSPVLDSILAGRLPDNSNMLELFVNKFNLQKYRLGIARLEAGIPATIEHLGMQIQSSNSTNDKKSARLVAEATGAFITCMDALKLNYNTKEQLHPLLSSLVVSLNDLVMSSDIGNGDAGSSGAGAGGSSIDFVGKSKLVSWLIKLNGLAAGQALDQQEIDSFLDDLDTAYRGFYTSLED